MTRLLSGLVLAAITLAAVLFLPNLGLRVLALGVSLIAAHELRGIARASGLAASPVLAYGFVAVVCWSMSVAAPRADLVLLSAMAFLLVDVLFLTGTLGAAGAGIASGIYIGVPLGALVAVHAAGGRHTGLLLIATVVTSDSAQYY